MRLVVVGLGLQRSPHHFRELLASGPIYARDRLIARAWLGSEDIDVIGLDEYFEHSPVAELPDRIVEKFHEAAQQHGSVCYLVPGAANVGDVSVQWLSRAFDVTVHPGALDVPVACGSSRIVDALSLALAEEARPFDSGCEALDSAIATIVTNVRGSLVQRLAAARLQRELGKSGTRHSDHMLVFEAESEPGPTTAFAGLLRILATLRSPDGCPWDREQTVDTLLPQLDEELEEFREAWDSGANFERAEELGDVLLHIAMIAQVAGEQGAFDASDVVRAISAKMVRRHPHVFGDAEIGSIDELYEMWAAIKRQEKAASEG